MIGNSNLQFTNATQLNDPFDCHPSLLYYSKGSNGMNQESTSAEWQKEIMENDALCLRDDTWLCSLSKINNSIVMWSHYGDNHRGACIGLDMEQVKHSVPPMFGQIYLEPIELEVKYRDILKRPEYDYPSWLYQWQTKAKEWEYEQEIRLLIKEPSPMYAALTPEQSKRKDVIDWKEVHHYMPLRGECFESIYFGIKIAPAEKAKIVNYAISKLNPHIKICQMGINKDALRLEPILECHK